MNTIIRTIAAAAVIGGAALALTACGTDSTATGASQTETVVNQQKDVQSTMMVPATTPADAGLPTTLSAPGTYVAGQDIPAGVWAPARFTSTDDVKSVAVNGVPAKLYRPTDTDSGKLHVTFQDPPATTGIGGDGYQRADGTWDISMTLAPGDTVTLSAPLTVPLAQFSDMSGQPVTG